MMKNDYLETTQGEGILRCESGYGYVGYIRFKPISMVCNFIIKSSVNPNRYFRY